MALESRRLHLCLLECNLGSCFRDSSGSQSNLGFTGGLQFEQFLFAFR